MILALGGRQLSFGQTSPVAIEWLLALFPAMEEATARAIFVAIRKGAHLVEYGILAAAWTWALVPHRAQTFALLLLPIAATAILDEGLQAFRPSRTGSIVDVLIDLTGAGLVLLFLWWSSNRKDHSAAATSD